MVESETHTIPLLTPEVMVDVRSRVRKLTETELDVLMSVANNETDDQLAASASVDLDELREYLRTLAVPSKLNLEMTAFPLHIHYREALTALYAIYDARNAALLDDLDISEEVAKRLLKALKPSVPSGRKDKTMSSKILLAGCFPADILLEQGHLNLLYHVVECDSVQEVIDKIQDVLPTFSTDEIRKNLEGLFRFLGIPIDLTEDAQLNTAKNIYHEYRKQHVEAKPTIVDLVLPSASASVRLPSLFTQEGIFTPEAVEHVAASIATAVRENRIAENDQMIMRLIAGGEAVEAVLKKSNMKKSDYSSVLLRLKGILNFPRVKNDHSIPKKGRKSGGSEDRINLLTAWKKYLETASVVRVLSPNEEALREYYTRVGFRAKELGMDDPTARDTEVFDFERRKRAREVGKSEDATWLQVFVAELRAGVVVTVPDYCKLDGITDPKQHPEQALELARHVYEAL